MDMAIIGVAGLFLLIGLVALFLSHKNWPWYNLMLVFFNIAACVTLWYMTARTLKIKAAWGGEERAWFKQVETKEAELLSLRDGNEAGDGADDRYGIDDLRTQKIVALNNRGPVWIISSPGEKPQANGNPVDPVIATLGINGAKISGKVEFRTEQAPVGLAKDKIVYLFEDTSSKVQTPKLTGAMYLGQYKITGGGGKSYEVERLLPVLPSLDQNFAFNNKPVVIYEVFPNDDYNAFANRTPAQIKQLLSEADPNEVQEYLQHGKLLTAAEAEAITKVENIPAAATAEERANYEANQKYRVWFRMKMLQETSVDDLLGKQAAAPKAAAPKPDPDADPNADPNAEPMAEATPDEGEATVVAKLKAGAVIVVDPETAQKWIQDKVAEYDDKAGTEYRVYYRNLHDFPIEDLRYREQLARLDQSILETDRLMALNVSTQQSTTESIAIHEQQIAKLTQDQAKITLEQQTITSYGSKLFQQVVALRAQRDQLLQQIASHGKLITQLQTEAARKVNERISSQEQAAARSN